MSVTETALVKDIKNKYLILSIFLSLNHADVSMKFCLYLVTVYYKNKIKVITGKGKGHNNFWMLVDGDGLLERLR